MLTEMTSRIQVIGERCSEAAAGTGRLCAVPQHLGYNWPPDRGIAILLDILLASGSVLAIPRFNPAAISPAATVLLKDALAVEYDSRPMVVVVDGERILSGDVVHWNVDVGTAGPTTTTTTTAVAPTGIPDDASSGTGPSNGVHWALLVGAVVLVSASAAFFYVWQLGRLHRGPVAPDCHHDGGHGDRASDPTTSPSVLRTTDPTTSPTSSPTTSVGRFQKKSNNDFFAPTYADALATVLPPPSPASNLNLNLDFHLEETSASTELALGRKPRPPQKLYQAFKQRAAAPTMSRSVSPTNSDPTMSRSVSPTNSDPTMLPMLSLHSLHGDGLGEAASHEMALPSGQPNGLQRRPHPLPMATTRLQPLRAENAEFGL